MRGSLAFVMVALLALCSCGSVELPREHFWRLDLPAPAGGELPRGGVLRVADLQLGNALSGDCLVRADGPLHLEQLELQRWIAPLDRLITDAVVLGLARTRMFTLVKTAADPGTEDRTLHGRVTEFAEQVQGDQSIARASIHFWVENEHGVAFAEELSADVPLQGHGPEASVRALSHALQQVLDELVGRMRASGLLDGPIDAAPVPGK